MAVEMTTWAEMEAWDLMYGSGIIHSNSGSRAEVNNACNKIIDLAERIKSSRADATMQLAANLQQAR